MKNTPLALALVAGLAFAAGNAIAGEPVDDPPKDPAAAAQYDAMDVAAQEPVTNTDRMDAADSDQPVEDTWITTKVKSSLLADTATAGTRIDVETNNGVVALSGHLDSQAQVDAAVRIAEGIKGVSRVDSSDLLYGTMADYQGVDDDEMDRDDRDDQDDRDY